MADIAVIFHWPPAAMDVMPLDELLNWHGLALDRWKRVNTKPTE